MLVVKYKTYPVELLREIFRYEDGKLFWKISPCNNTKIGTEAGMTRRKLGYKRVYIKDKEYLQHRVIWALLKGYWPKDYLDHIDGDPSNNRIENLREATNSENMRNQYIHRTGHRNGKPIGVYYRKSKNHWRAVAPKRFLNRNENKGKEIGIYKTMEEAKNAVVEFCSREK